MSETEDRTQKLIDEINRTQHELLGSIYSDFYGGDASPSGGMSGEGRTDGDRAEHPKISRTDGGSADHPENCNTPGDQAGEAAPHAPAPKPEEPEEDPMETLDKLIGLDQIKDDVRELADFAKVQKARKDAGMKSVPISMHLVFTGNPGTGKTTVARILAKIYKNIGVLPQGQLVETDRSGLVAGYVGQTAIKTQEMIGKAMGGVLFIDEAYALAQKDDAFGQEAIDTLLKAMEDHRDELVVIVAGYTKPMEKFINSNPGLKSRFNKYIEFPDYTMDELMGIFRLDCRKYDYTIDEDTLKHVRELLNARRLASLDNFANAREVRNLFESIITNQARRVADLKDPSREDMMKILPEDLLDQPVGKSEAESDTAADQPVGKDEAECGTAADQPDSDKVPEPSEPADPAEEPATDAPDSGQ